MKKKLVMMMVVGAFLFCVGCGKDTDTTPPVTDGQAEDEVVVSDTEDKEDEVVSTEEESESSIELSQTGRKATSEGAMYIDAPDWRGIACGYTQVYKVGGGIGGNYYVAFTVHQDETATTAKEAYPLALDVFKESVSNYGSPDSLIIESEEEMTINGLDVYRFQGNLNCHEGKKLEYAVGYSFVWDGNPCLVIGVVRDEDQHQEFIDTVTEAVDAMICTVRSEK